jgi:hypothetical protein
MPYISHLINASKWYFNIQNRLQFSRSQCQHWTANFGIILPLVTNFKQISTLSVLICEYSCDIHGDATGRCDRQCHHLLGTSSGICLATYEHCVTVLDCPTEGFTNTIRLNVVICSSSVRVTQIL